MWWQFIVRHRQMINMPTFLRFDSPVAEWHRVSLPSVSANETLSDSAAAILFLQSFPVWRLLFHHFFVTHKLSIALVLCCQWMYLLVFKVTCVEKQDRSTGNPIFQKAGSSRTTLWLFTILVSCHKAACHSAALRQSMSVFHLKFACSSWKKT